MPVTPSIRLDVESADELLDQGWIEQLTF